jgi:Trypsin-co-occurring domain 1
VTASELSGGSAEAYEVAVAVVPIERTTEVGGQETGEIPGYDESWGRGLGAHAAGSAVLIEKGEDAVRAATEAIARQIGIAAQRIVETIEKESWSPSAPGALGLETVEVTFGVTLAAGIQTVFTAQAGSSAQVSITLSRQHGS